MTEPNTTAAATPLRRPPVLQPTTVGSAVTHSFVRTIGWWPLRRFSAGREGVRDVTAERPVSRRAYETWDDGTVVVRDELPAWEPPSRFVMTRNGTPAVTEVDLALTALGPVPIRVTVEHRGWENLTDDQLDEDCALSGGYRSGAYATGWERMLCCFTAAVEG